MKYVWYNKILFNLICFKVTKSDLNETMMNLEQSEALALNLEQAAQDKAVLQKRLQHSLEKEGKNKQANCEL